MKQTLTIKTGQQLAMTTALRQGIELLNLPSQEIEAKIQETLDSNIMLEEDAPGDEDTSASVDSENSLHQAEQISESEADSSGEVVEMFDLEIDRSAMIADDVPDASDEKRIKRIGLLSP